MTVLCDLLSMFIDACDVARYYPNFEVQSGDTASAVTLRAGYGGHRIVVW